MVNGLNATRLLMTVMAIAAVASPVAAAELEAEPKSELAANQAASSASDRAAHKQAEIACPATLGAVDQKLAQVPDGWQPFQGPSRHHLIGVELTLGHPREQSGAIYDSVTRIKNGKGAQVLRWRVARLHDPYLVCHYFDTDVALTRSVSGYAVCEMVEVAEGGRKRPQQARCY